MTIAAAPSLAVWSLTVRLTHWSVAALVLFNLFNDSGSKIHRYAGYAAAGLVAVRGIYGLVQRKGPAGLHVPTPAACWRHACAMVAGRPPRLAGHNPLGAAMGLLLWTLIVLLFLSGWISRWDAFWGEDWPVDIHHWLSIALQVALLLHLGGVLLSSLLERQNLLLAMVSGRKQVDATPPMRD